MEAFHSALAEEAELKAQFKAAKLERHEEEKSSIETIYDGKKANDHHDALKNFFGADFDLDLDGKTNLEEYLLGTNPNDHGLRWAITTETLLTFELDVEADVASYSQVQELVIIEIQDFQEIPPLFTYIPGAPYLA